MAAGERRFRAIVVLCLGSVAPSALAGVDPSRMLAQQPQSSDHAYAFLVLGEPYVSATAVCAAALRMSGTQADVVTMTWGVENADALVPLERLLVRVKPLAAHEIVRCPHPVSRTGALNALHHLACTKLPSILGLVEYRTVVYVDSDLMLVDSVDHLFSLPLRAHGRDLVGAAGNPEDARDIDARGRVEKNLNSGLMVLAPSAAVRAEVVGWMNGLRNTSAGTRRSKRADQKLTAAFYDGRVLRLPSTLNWGLWNVAMRAQKPSGRSLLAWAAAHPPVGVHFSGSYKPWLPPSAPEQRTWARLPASARAFAEPYGCVWGFLQAQVSTLRVLGPLPDAQHVTRLLRRAWRARGQPARCFETARAPTAVVRSVFPGAHSPDGSSSPL